MDKETFRKIRDLIFIAGLVLVVALNITNVINGVAFVIGILYPFFLGCCLAFILNVPMSFFERVIFNNRKTKDTKFSKKMSRPLSIIISLLIGIALFLTIMFYVIPKLSSAVSNLGDTLKVDVPLWFSWLEQKFKKYPQIVTWIEDHDFSSIKWADVLDELMSGFISGSSNAVHNFLTVATKIIGQATNVIIAIAFSIYVCAAKEKHRKRTLSLVYSAFPKKAADQIRHVAAICYEAFHHFITGQCLECVCNGFLVGTVMAIAGMPYSFLIAIVCACCCLIPMFGAIMAGVFGAIVVLTVSPARMAAFLILYVIIRTFDDNFMYPRIMGNSINMPSIYVLIGITVGGALFGFGGMLFFIPLTSVIYNLVKDAVERKMKKKVINVDDEGKVIFGDRQNMVQDKTIHENKSS
ncbi:MAG TPA: AI-2E family transporter [Lachnospiraceae bacterium]|nr:AI-2E family transporter [Lachnospiraceae bacterium]